MSQKTEIQKFKQGKKDAENFIAETLRKIKEAKMQDLNKIKYLVGMTENAALDHLQACDIRFRVTRRDSLVAIVTSDYDTDRINLEIDNNKVTKVSYG